MKSLKRTICLILFVLSFSCVFSQLRNDTILINLEKIDENGGFIEDENKNKRDLELLSVLPVITYNPEFDELCIESDIVNFDNVVYEICDVNASVVSYGTVSLLKNEEVFVSTSMLPSGMGYIYISIGGSTFVGEFRKE